MSLLDVKIGQSMFGTIVKWALISVQMLTSVPPKMICRAEFNHLRQC